MDDSGVDPYHPIVYAVASFVLVLLAVMLMYVACSRRYRLNWFEKNLLESADVEYNRRQISVSFVDSNSKGGEGREKEGETEREAVSFHQTLISYCTLLVWIRHSIKNNTNTNNFPPYSLFSTHKRYRLISYLLNCLDDLSKPNRCVQIVVLYSSQEALVTGSMEAVGISSVDGGSRRSLNRSPSQDMFWVPPNLQRQSSLCPSEESSNGKQPMNTPGVVISIQAMFKDSVCQTPYFYKVSFRNFKNISLTLSSTSSNINRTRETSSKCGHISIMCYNSGQSEAGL